MITKSQRILLLSNALSFFQKIWIGFLLLSFIVTTTPTTMTTNAFLLKSTGTGGWATGFDYNPDDQSYIISGTMYTNNFWDITVLGAPNDKFQCFVVQVVHDETTNSANVLQTVSRALANPQICVGGAQLIDHGNSGFAAVMGTSGLQASVQLLTQQSNNGDGSGQQQPIEPSTKFDLPSESIPVASTSTDGQHLFVAIHGTGGWTFPRETSKSVANPNVENLKGLSDVYWLPLTDPQLTENSFLQIRQYDTTTPSEFMVIDMELSSSSSGGKVVAAAMEHHTDNGVGSILVAGSTNGRGEVFGTPSDFLAAEEAGDTDGIWDGYLTWLDDSTGDLQHAMRLNINPGFDDNVHDICRQGNFLFVVGTTWEPTAGDGGSGRLEPKGFLLKVDLIGKTILWTVKDLEGPARKCAADSSNVYVAKYVSQNYGTQGSPPALSQNIRITKYSAGPTHPEVWTEVIDTTISTADIRQDYIVGLELGPTGNLVALMNSINYDRGFNDIVLLEFLKDTGRNDLNYEPTSDKKDPNEEGGDGNDDRNPPTSPPRNKVKGDDGTDEDQQQKKIIVALAIAIPVLICLLVACYHFACNRVGIEKVAESTASTAAEHELSLQNTDGEETNQEREVV